MIVLKWINVISERLKTLEESVVQKSIANTAKFEIIQDGIKDNFKLHDDTKRLLLKHVEKNHEVLATRINAIENRQETHEKTNSSFKEELQKQNDQFVASLSEQNDVLKKKIINEHTELEKNVQQGLYNQTKKQQERFNKSEGEVANLAVAQRETSRDISTLQKDTSQLRGDLRVTTQMITDQQERIFQDISLLNDKDITKQRIITEILDKIAESNTANLLAALLRNDYVKNLLCNLVFESDIFISHIERVSILEEKYKLLPDVRDSNGSLEERVKSMEVAFQELIETKKLGSNSSTENIMDERKEPIVLLAAKPAVSTALYNAALSDLEEIPASSTEKEDEVERRKAASEYLTRQKKSK